MRVSEVLGFVERWVSRIRLVEWLSCGTLSAAAGVMSGYLVQATGGSIVGAILAGIGGFALVVVVSLLIFILLVRFKVFDNWLPLEEAAVRAYEQTPGTSLADLLVGANQTSHDKVKNYADMIFHKLPIEGKKPPSRIYERIYDDEKANIYVRDDLDSAAPVLRQGEVTVSDIRVRKSDLKNFVKWAKEDTLF